MKTWLVIGIFILGMCISSRAEAGSVWVWANNATATSYVPAAKFTKGPPEGQVHVKRISPGRYQVTLSGWKYGPPQSSNVQVTAYGSGSNYCKVASWSPSGDALSTQVNCFTASGTPDDSLFSALITFQRPQDTDGTNAFAWSSSARASHKAKKQYAKNGGRQVRVNRVKTGVYEAVFSGYLSERYNGGNVQVTAYGKSNAYCKIRDWEKKRTDLVATVLCFQPSGAPIDSLFSILVHGP